MRPLTSILLLIACLVIIPSQAQTPYDTFAPETSRPMLGLDAISSVSSERPTAVESMSDSAVYAIVIDPKQQSVYLLNFTEHTLLAAAPLTDDVLKWLSVDPLSDKYPNISPYAYCNWNPIKYVDPDGRKSRYYIKWADRQKDAYMLKAFLGWQKRYDDSRLHFWFHGNKDGLYNISINNTTKTYDINVTKDFKAINALFSNDPMINNTWIGITSANSEYKSPREVVFHGCYTAQLAEAFAKKYPGVYFTGATLPNHTKILYFDYSSPTMVESGVYGYLIPIGDTYGIWKIDGMWQTYYCDPQTHKLRIILNNTNIAPPVNGNL